MNKYPKTKTTPFKKAIHGQTINDNYHWLENGQDKKVQQWVDEQNNFTDLTLKKHTKANLFQEELTKNFREHIFGNPVPTKGKYFYQERKPNEDQFVLYVKNSLKAKARKLIDPNGANKDNTITIDFWYISDTGKYIAYGLSQGGDEVSTIHIKDVDTKKDLEDIIPNTRYSSIAWLADDSGFYYTKHPTPGTVPKGDETYYCKVYFHKIGSNPKKDKLIFGDNRPKEDMIGLSLSPDGRYLRIYASQSWAKNDVFIFDSQQKKLLPIIVGLEANFTLSFTKNKMILLTNYKAKKYRILHAKLTKIPKSINEWQELIPESKNVISGFCITKSKLLLTYMVDVCSKLYEFDFNGNKKAELPVPAFGDVHGFGARRSEEEFFYSVVSFIEPTKTYRYNPKTKNISLYRQEKNLIDPNDYIVKQEWYKSKDSTKVPMFIIHHKSVKLDGNNPTLLTGYGGFEVSNTPIYSRIRVSWISRNGIHAVANIRGGGEYGEKWHKDGILFNKQNSFDDFIAAADHLIKRKYTNKNKLAIRGGSNGGLLVGATMVQRPDLFKAVICEVPLLDMVNYHKFLMAKLWVGEYGDPDKSKDFKNIIKWSPYQNVNKDVEYPNIFLLTANKDNRVDPMHARKMAAQLQSINKTNIVLLATEKEAGHGPGMPVYKMVKEQADILAFLAWQLGLKI